MSDTVRLRTEALRDEVFAQLQAHELYVATVALDEAVAALGGQRRLPRKVTFLKPSSAPGAGVVMSITERGVSDMDSRVSQPEAAAAVLQEVGRPLPVRELLPLLLNKGVRMTASDPVASLGSQLSRNPDRFESRRIDGVHLWWIKGLPWPKAENDLLPEEV